jgi:hypothetical protein
MHGSKLSSLQLLLVCRQNNIPCCSTVSAPVWLDVRCSLNRSSGPLSTVPTLLLQCAERHHLSSGPVLFCTIYPRCLFGSVHTAAEDWSVSFYYSKAAQRPAASTAVTTLSCDCQPVGLTEEADPDPHNMNTFPPIRSTCPSRS